MSFLMWILLIIVIIGIVYYIGETYGTGVGGANDKKKKEKESYSDRDSDDEDEEDEVKVDKKKKKIKEKFSESEEDDDKKKKKKVKDICFGDLCLPKDRIQEEIEDMDDDTKEELIKMLKKQ